MASILDVVFGQTLLAHRSAAASRKTQAIARFDRLHDRTLLVCRLAMRPDEVGETRRTSAIARTDGVSALPSQRGRS
jgi:hypothetical protein